jgi:hypothetical protein
MKVKKLLNIEQFLTKNFSDLNFMELVHGWFFIIFRKLLIDFALFFSITTSIPSLTISLPS